MKIRIDKLKIIDGKKLIVNIENIEFEISTKEIQEMNEHENKKSEEYIPSALRSKPKILSYTFRNPKSWSGKGATEICIGDEVEVMCSEDCFTNADTIKYDEKISGKTFVISAIEAHNNKVLLSNAFYVHPTWLKFIARKK